jgi:hypothetical protein
MDGLVHERIHSLVDYEDIVEILGSRAYLEEVSYWWHALEGHILSLALFCFLATMR